MIINWQSIDLLAGLKREAINAVLIVASETGELGVEFLQLLVELFDLLFVGSFLLVVSGADTMAAPVGMIFGLARGRREPGALLVQRFLLAFESIKFRLVRHRWIPQNNFCVFF